MTYSEQIKHPKWQKKRLEILERDEFRCSNCDSKDDTLHVHHYIYKKNKKIWEYRNSDLTTFCEDCHKEWHLIHDDIKEFLKLDIQRLKETQRIIINLSGLNPYILQKFNEIIVAIRVIGKIE